VGREERHGCCAARLSRPGRVAHRAAQALEAPRAGGHSSAIRSNLPSGTVTFLFTDVEGSTRLLNELGAEGYAEELARHRRVIREACARQGGAEVDTQGDAFFFAFESAASALAAAETLTEALSATPIRVRVGVHTGTPLLGEEGYVGADVHVAARVGAAGHGGQVVLSAAAAELVGLPLTPLGTHRLKDLAEPVALFQFGAGAFPPLKTIANTNLPTPASSFLGREDELDQADLLLAQTRLLTVTGPGGAGKTRFALELARRAREERFGDYAAGVFSCFLASLRDPALVLPTICQTLSVREEPGTSAVEALAAHLEGKRMLLLLDNLEHLLACVRELSALLEACPGLSLLVTSRALLRASGELDFELPPLADDGVALFCERARSEPSQTIAELCRRLDGLPLAIELAAARTRILSPSQLLERLASRLDLLKGGRDADPRQQTLRATIAWSYDLLSEEEQRLFGALSVFAGGCTLETAEEVAGADLDTLQSLLDKSLLRRTDGRFWMLETIREYAQERLEESGDGRAVRRRHGLHFCLLAHEGESRLRSAEQLTWLDRLDREHDNLRAALEWALDEGDALAAVKLAADLGPFWSKRGHVAEARRSLDLVLDASRGSVTRGRAAALRLAGRFALDQDDPDAGRRFLEESAELSRRIGDHAGLSRTLGDLSWWAELVQGDRSHARSLADESLALARDHGDREQLAEALNARAGVALGEGDFAEARSAWEEARLLHHEVGDRGSEARIIGNLGWLALAAADYPTAASILEDGCRLAEELGDKPQYASANSFLGFALVHLGEQARASEVIMRGLELHVELRRPRLIVECLYALAGNAGAQVDGQRAVRLAGAAERLLEELHLPVLPIEVATLDRFVLPMRAELGQDVFAATWASGRAMSLDEAVEYAVEHVRA
jgi:predicted ATPase/class 3 adenylate cyclase